MYGIIIIIVKINIGTQSWILIVLRVMTEPMSKLQLLFLL
jgi:hypothetical protein